MFSCTSEPSRFFACIGGLLFRMEPLTRANAHERGRGLLGVGIGIANGIDPDADGDADPEDGTANARE
jgi:hypothetical protein